jgi:hypothetical protein
MKTSIAIVAPLALACIAVAGDLPILLSSNLSYSATTGANGSVIDNGTWDPMVDGIYKFQYVSIFDNDGNPYYQYNFFIHGTSEYDADSGQTLFGDAYDVVTLGSQFAGSVTFNFTLASAARFASFYADPGVSATLNGAALTASTYTVGDTLAAGNYTLNYSFGANSSYEVGSFRFTEFPAGIPAPGAMAVLGMAGLARGRRRK